MRLLADENIPLPSVWRLRQANHDVVAVAEEMPGATDRVVLSRANQDHRVILTFDRDYGTLIYRHGLPAPAGVIYFRAAPLYPEAPAEQLLTLTTVPGLAFEGKMTVVGMNQVRQRHLP
jgi:predicted nuclease of predicted toxin-antitoxin system